MVRLLSALAFSGLLLGETPDAKHPAISVFMDFDVKPATESVETMKREVETLLKPSGVVLNWHSAREAACEQDASFVVVKFKGKCRVERWNQPPDAPGSISTLGKTAVDHGRVLPFTEVECDQVRKGLFYLGPAAGSHQRQTALGLAMGRVVAHELYHILAHTTGHAAHGLAKATESLRDLVSGAPAFQAEDSKAVGSGLRH